MLVHLSRPNYVSLGISLLQLPKGANPHVSGVRSIIQGQYFYLSRPARVYRKLPGIAMAPRGGTGAPALDGTTTES